MPADQSPSALTLEGITRRFGQVMALDKAAITVRRGTVHALLGENGAGKTTLMRVAFGLVQPDAGTIAVNGVANPMRSPSAALAAGVGMVHQHFTLVPAMSVAENVALGTRGLFRPAHWADRVNEIGQRTGLVIDPAARVSDLPVGAQQRCEIIKALARDVRVLILDEPTAVLAPQEAQDLLRWVRSFADAGNSVVLITHKLRDALSVADDVTVLRRGKTALSARISETSEQALAAAMLGEDKESIREQPLDSGDAKQRDAKTPKSDDDRLGPAILRLDHVTVRNELGVLQLNDVSLEVHAGEIVGVAGVEGSGQNELLRTLAGRLVPSLGSVFLPDDVGFVPEDRHLDALLLDATLVENIALRNAGDRSGRMPWNSLASDTREILSTLRVRTAGEFANARTLSGGNQQKLIIGRELFGSPTALVVENPTRGLDFRAASSVQEAIKRARANGAAVVVYSSDLDEVLALADRVVVVHEGRVTEVPTDRDAVGLAMLGATSR